MVLGTDREMFKLSGCCRRRQPRRHSRWTVLSFLIFGVLILILSATQTSLAQTSQSKAPDYSESPKGLAGLFAYRPRQVRPADLTNSKNLSEMIRDGKIELSLSQLASAVVENNLNLAVDRYFNYSAQADLLRARGGQAARGVQAVGAAIPDALFSAAIGAGVGGGGGAFGGLGGVGSISGATRSFTISPRGSFDPAFTFDASWDRTTNPLNTVVVAGAPVVTTHTSFFSFGYVQAFP